MPAGPPKELVVASAYFALLGYGQKTIAKRLNRTTRTIQLWKHHEMWPECMAVAKEKFRLTLAGYARRAVRRGLGEKDGGWLALQVLERFEPEEWMAPAQRLKLMGDPDNPLRVAGEMTPEQRNARLNELHRKMNPDMIALTHGEPDKG